MGLFSLLTKSTLISLSSLGTGGGRSPFCGCMGIAVRCPVLLFEKLGIKLKNTLHPSPFHVKWLSSRFVFGFYYGLPKPLLCLF